MSTVDLVVSVRTGVVHHQTCAVRRFETVPWTPRHRFAGDRACLMCMPDGLPPGNQEGWD